MAPEAFDYDGSCSLTKRVCVMDAGGCLGSSLVHSLLQRGYFVHAAVHANNVEMESMERTAVSNKKLRVFQTDPLDYHSIVEALEGCCGLFYSFEPPSDQPSYDELMAEMEVRAAHNVLEACAQTDTIDKVVFTSSATALIWRDPSDSTPSSFDVDERNWSNVNFCKKFKSLRPPAIGSQGFGTNYSMQFRPGVPAQPGHPYMQPASGAQQYRPMGQPDQFSQPMQQMPARPGQPAPSLQPMPMSYMQPPQYQNPGAGPGVPHSSYAMHTPVAPTGGQPPFWKSRSG